MGNKSVKESTFESIRAKHKQLAEKNAKTRFESAHKISDLHAQTQTLATSHFMHDKHADAVDWLGQLGTRSIYRI